jgi:hypothetical protein
MDQAKSGGKYQNRVLRDPQVCGGNSTSNKKPPKPLIAKAYSPSTARVLRLAKKLLRW